MMRFFYKFWEICKLNSAAVLGRCYLCQGEEEAKIPKETNRVE
jgi:hypothetical protein